MSFFSRSFYIVILMYVGSNFFTYPLCGQNLLLQEEQKNQLLQEEDFLEKNLSSFLEKDFTVDLEAPSPLTKRQEAIIALLDKTTGRVKNESVTIGSPFLFGRLQITVHSCYRTLPEEAPESIAFVEISEKDPTSETQQTLFRSWMYASSPSVSSLDHPIYDMWLKGCKGEGL